MTNLTQKVAWQLVVTNLTWRGQKIGHNKITC